MIVLLLAAMTGAIGAGYRMIVEWTDRNETKSLRSCPECLGRGYRPSIPHLTRRQRAVRWVFWPCFVFLLYGLYPRPAYWTYAQSKPEITYHIPRFFLGEINDTFKWRSDDRGVYGWMDEDGLNTEEWIDEQHSPDE